MLEKQIETYLYNECLKRGWLCEKFTSPGRRSVPDRIITAPGPVIFFVECKAPGKTATNLQYMDHQRRIKLGCDVRVVDTKKVVDVVIKQVEEKVCRTKQ